MLTFQYAHISVHIGGKEVRDFWEIWLFYIAHPEMFVPSGNFRFNTSSFTYLKNTIHQS